MIKLNGFSAANTRFSAAGACALLAGTGLLVASAISFQQSSHLEPLNSKIVLDLKPLSQLTQMPLQVSPEADKVSTAAATVANVTQTFPQEAAPLHFTQPLVSATEAAPAQVHFQVAHHRHAAPKPRVHVASQSRVIQDSLSLGQAQAVSAALVQVQADATAETLEAFQAMHRQLRQRVSITLRDGGRTDIEFAQVTSQPVTIHLVPQMLAEAPVATPKKVRAAQAAPAPTEPKFERVAATESAPAVTLVSAAILAPTPAALSDSNPQLTTQIHSLRAQVKALRRTDSDTTTVSAPSNDEETISTATAQNVAAAAPQTTTAGVQFTPAVVSGAPTAMTTQAGNFVSVGGVMVSAPAGYSSQAAQAAQNAKSQSGYSGNLFAAYRAWVAQHPSAAQNVPTAQPQTQSLTPSVQIAQADRSMELTKADADSGIIPPAPPAPPAPAAASLVEAFEWNTQVQTTDTQVLTLEGWKQAQATDHWPVIYWDPNGDAQTALISHNTAVMLALRADRELQPDAAIVFGKIPAGWNVEYSDRSESVVYLDAQNQPAPTADAERYFAFINAAPGAQLVTLKSALGADTAAVVVPVQNGVSTYADLTAVAKRTFSGSVLDARAQARQGIANATVNVVGQPNAVIFTTESGYFRFSEIYTVGTFPVFAETTTTSGFKHRYRLASDQLNDAQLFRLGETQIRDWLSQLEGGVSPDSGLIVAAVPGLVQAYGDGRLFASTHSLAQTSATLTPETYTLEEDGYLENGAPLERAAPRFVSVQVPNGPVVSQVEDNNRNVIWSQLVLAQPGVINIVGPY